MRHLSDVDICVKACSSLCVRVNFSLRFAGKFHPTLSKLGKLFSIGNVRLSRVKMKEKESTKVKVRRLISSLM